MAVNVRWLGTTGVELSHNGQFFLLDPSLSRPGDEVRQIEPFMTVSF